METSTSTITQPATYGPFVTECARHGISRTVAYDLASKGLLKTFKIGTRRFVWIESLRTLPERLEGAK